MPYEEARTRSMDLAESTGLPHSLVLLAKMILLSAEGISRIEVVRCASVSAQALGKRRGRFLGGGAWWNCMNSSAPAATGAQALNFTSLIWYFSASFRVSPSNSCATNIA